MAVKLGVCFSHQASDPWKYGSLIRNIAKRGRELLEGVSTLSGRSGNFGKRPIVDTKAESTRLAVACKTLKPVLVLKNVANGLFRSSPHTLASRFAQRIGPQPYWSTISSYKQLYFLGKRLATFSFVGVALPAHKEMFRDRAAHKATSVDGDDVCYSRLEDFELSGLLSASTFSTTFGAKIKTAMCTNEKSGAIEDITTESTSDTSFGIQQLNQSHDLEEDYGDDTDDSDSDDSIEVIDDWNDAVVINYAQDFDSGDCDADTLELICKLDAMVKLQQIQLDEISHAVSDQQKKLKKFPNSQITTLDANSVVMRVTWMTDRSVDYSNQVLNNELLAASERSRPADGCKLPPHFNVAPVIGGFLTTRADVKGIIGESNVLPVVNHWQNDIALCIVTKKYDFSLSEYLASHTLTFSDSMMLFLQLLEAVVHLGVNNVCHGDLRSDNILVELLPDGPRLLLANFASSARIKTKSGFRAHSCAGAIPIKSYNFLTAPEIFVKDSSYSKADLWACGAISYEIFGCDNPFRLVCGSDNKRLTSILYDDSNLPDLSNSAPPFVNCLVKMMLRRDPSERPDAELAANIMHVGIWGPGEWQMTTPHWLDVKRWLIHFAASTYCTQHQVANRRFNHSFTDGLKAMFLSRSSFTAVSKAVHFLRVSAAEE